MRKNVDGEWLGVIQVKNKKTSKTKVLVNKK